MFGHPFTNDYVRTQCAEYMEYMSTVPHDYAFDCRFPRSNALDGKAIPKLPTDYVALH